MKLFSLIMYEMVVEREQHSHTHLLIHTDCVILLFCLTLFHYVFMYDCC